MGKTKNKFQIAGYIDSELRQWLLEQAAKNQRSLSWVVEQGLTYYSRSLKGDWDSRADALGAIQSQITCLVMDTVQQNPQINSRASQVPLNDWGGV